MARISWHCAEASCRLLQSVGWLRTETAPKSRRPVATVPASTQAKAAAAFEELYALSPNRGEFLMRRLLDLFLFSDRSVDNARPGFLENPATNVPLEYDRYYPLDGVAFEFNGPQHQGPTAAGGDQAFRETVTRDLVKAALSAQAAIRLVSLTAEDLRPERFERLLPPELRRRPVDTDGAFFHTLARVCTAYADKAQRAGRK